jgi:hypothetical protein
MTRDESALIAQRDNLSRLTHEIIEAKGRAALALYEMGVRLLHVHEQELWRAGRFDGFGDYLARAVDVPVSSAYRCIRFARHFNRQICARYGVDKLEAIVRYERVTAAKERAGDLLAAEIALRKENGRYTKKSLHLATAGEINAATALLERAKKGRRRIPAEARAKVERLAAVLPAAPRGLSTKNRARLSRGKDGRLALSISAVPLDEVAQLIDALRETLL